MIPQPGTCRHCGCTEDNACVTPTGDPCSWMNKQRDVCSNPACIKAEADRVARIPKPRKRTPADIHELIRRGNRKPRKGRAA